MTPVSRETGDDTRRERAMEITDTSYGRWLGEVVNGLLQVGARDLSELREIAESDSPYCPWPDLDACALWGDNIDGCIAWLAFTYGYGDWPQGTI